MADEIEVNKRRVLLLHQAAAAARVSVGTWTSYVSRRWPRGNPAPVADGHIDRRTPYWFPETIEAWMISREPQN